MPSNISLSVGMTPSLVEEEEGEEEDVELSDDESDHDFVQEVNKNLDVWS